MDHAVYLGIAALSSILTAIPIVVGMLLLGAKYATRADQPPPRPQREPEPEPELWVPAFADGYGWDDDEDGEL